MVAEGGPSAELYRARYAAAYEQALAYVEAEIKTGRLKLPSHLAADVFAASQAHGFACCDLRCFANSRGERIDPDDYATR